MPKDNPDLTRYKGKWVLIEGEKVLASGRSIKEVYDKAIRLRPDSEGFYYKFVPELVGSVYPSVIS